MNRRRHAIALMKQRKASLSDVACQVGACKISVSRWQQAYQESGSKALRSKQIPRRPLKLSSEQKIQLEQVHLAGLFVLEQWDHPPSQRGKALSV
jgi:transposase